MNRDKHELTSLNAEIFSLKRYVIIRNTYQNVNSRISLTKVVIICCMWKKMYNYKYFNQTIFTRGY